MKVKAKREKDVLAALSWVLRENLCVIVGTGVFPHLL